MKVWGAHPSDGGDVDDASGALSAHVWKDGLGHPHEAEDVDVEDALVLGDRAFSDGTRVAESGVVDQDVDAAERLDHLLDHRGDRRVADNSARGAGDGRVLEHLEPPRTRASETALPTGWVIDSGSSVLDVGEDFGQSEML
jgi:hypothetical protein